MGQQQLLLVILGVILVGIAIVVGINLFSASAIELNRDAVVADNLNLAARVQRYYNKPTALGGGNNSFRGFTIPTSLASTANGTFTARVNAKRVIITGTGVVKNSAGKKYVVVTTVRANSISTARPTLK